MNRTKYKENEIRADSLLRELRDYEREGTHLYLGDFPSRADEIVEACMLAEDSDYMRDFVSDDEERITEIHFIKITEEQEF